MSDSSSDLGDHTVRLRSGEEGFQRSGKPLSITLHDYWRWSASDLLSNASRGVLAEYLVASDLGCTEKPRVEWDLCDLVTKRGTRAGVKSAAYLQSWKQSELSGISFNIAPTRGWDKSANEYFDTAARRSDVYAFCLLNEKDKNKVDPLDVSQWQFFILMTEIPWAGH